MHERCGSFDCYGHTANDLGFYPDAAYFVLRNNEMSSFCSMWRKSMSLLAGVGQ